MARKKSSFSETTTPVIIEDENTEDKEEHDGASLRASLEEAVFCSGVIGYILKDSKSATIDLPDPEKTIEYAMLASQLFDSAQELSELFSLSSIEYTVIECSELKVLCATFGEFTFSIFMEKNVDHSEIFSKISS
jgi:predicted regulator of Ras-like GTPase activity (Roadblock/LC7/MglB family)